MYADEREGDRGRVGRIGVRLICCAMRYLASTVRTVHHHSSSRSQEEASRVAGGNCIGCRSCRLLVVIYNLLLLLNSSQTVTVSCFWPVCSLKTSLSRAHACANQAQAPPYAYVHFSLAIASKRDGCMTSYTFSELGNSCPIMSRGSIWPMDGDLRRYTCMHGHG
jgi:hypothetical protein